MSEQPRYLTEPVNAAVLHLVHELTADGEASHFVSDLDAGRTSAEFESPQRGRCRVTIEDLNPEGTAAIRRLAELVAQLPPLAGPADGEDLGEWIKRELSS